MIPAAHWERRSVRHPDIPSGHGVRSPQASTIRSLVPREERQHIRFYRLVITSRRSPTEATPLETSV